MVGSCGQPVSDGSSGSSLAGGQGGTGNGGGGGGGGGYYGGGGGGGGCSYPAGGGGGGSSFGITGLTNETTAVTAAAVRISYTVPVTTTMLRFDAHAYGARASIGTLTVGPTAAADLTCTITAGTGTGRGPLASTTVAGRGDTTSGQTATATSTLSGAQVGITTAGSITATATATTPANSDTVTATGTTTFSLVKVHGQVMPAHPAPNTTIHVGSGTVVLNEQTPIIDAAGDPVGIRVNAIDATFGQTHAIIGHASAALTLPGSDCPAP